MEVLLAAGIKVHRITNLANELAMALRARRIRLVAPIPGKNTVGIEVPNPHREVVLLRDLLESEAYHASRPEIPILLGKDGAGNTVVSDLSLMPHMLIAGATGSGKSVCLNSLIITCLMTRSPEELKMILVDPKMVELSDFADIPHLLCPVVTDIRGKGLMVAVEFADTIRAGDVFEGMLARGILVGCNPSYNCVRFMPPLTTGQDQIHTIADTLKDVLL